MQKDSNLAILGSFREARAVFIHSRGGQLFLAKAARDIAAARRSPAPRKKGNSNSFISLS